MWRSLPAGSSGSVAPRVFATTGVLVNGIGSPVTRDTSRSSARARVLPTTCSSSTSVARVSPAAAGSLLLRRLRAALLAVTEVVAVSALDAAPVLGLVALAGLMLDGVAVAAAHHLRLGAFAGDVALNTTVVAGTAASSASGAGFRAVGLVVSVDS